MVDVGSSVATVEVGSSVVMDSVCEVVDVGSSVVEVGS
jgi:hypothetical protein